MTNQYPCGKTRSFISRRDLLVRASCGFGAVALAALTRDTAFGGLAIRDERIAGPLSPRAPHFAPKIKRVVYLYMDGGPSQALQNENGANPIQ